MPFVEDPDTPGGRILRDATGGELARFVARENENRPFADLFAVADGVPAERAAGAVMTELRGWRVAGDESFARLLVKAGGTPRRHVHVMSRDLVRDPAPPAWLEPRVPDGLRLTPVDRPAIELAPACLAAYPREHPDFADMPHPEQPEIELDEIMSGRLMGPLLRCSVLAVAESGEVVGAVLVNATAGEPPHGGPWISQVFRRPDAPGVGGPLLRRALALATRDGLPAIGLAVTHANPALAVYTALGFVDVQTALNVEV